MLNKKMLVIGILLILFSVVIGGMTYSASFSSATTANREGLSLQPSSSIYVRLAVNSSSTPLLLYYSSAPVDFYLVNSTAFSSVEPYLSNASKTADLMRSLEGTGVMEVFSNSSLGVFPYTENLSRNFPPPSYTINGTIPAENATYYLIYSNKGSSYVNISYTYMYIPTVNSVPYAKRAFELPSIAAGLLFIAGLVISILSFLSGKRVSEKESDKEATRLYRRLEVREKRPSGRRGAKGRNRLARSPGRRQRRV